MSMYQKSSAKEVSLGVYPPVIRVKSIPEATVNLPITVFNNSESILPLDISFKPFYDSGKRDGSISYYAEKDVPQRDLDFMKVLTIEDQDIEIKNINLYPKEYKTLNLKFKMPKDIGSDYYFSIVLSSAVDTKSSTETRSYIVPGAAVNILVSGDKSEPSAVINELNTDILIFSGPTKLNLLVKNTSRNYEAVSGNVILYNTLGKEVERVKLETEIIISEAQRNMQQNNNTYNNQISLGSKFMLGLYTVKAEIMAENKLIAAQETKFFAIPLVFLLVLTIIIFVIFSILLRTLRKLNLKN